VLVYLDSSAIVKRYIEEIGAESLDLLYSQLEKREGDSEYHLAFSSWNLGEVFGAIDTRFQRGDIDKKSMMEALSLFSGETKKFVAMRKINVLPVGSNTLTMSRDLILKYHIYQADALQLASAKQVNAELFVSADRKLVDCAKLERIEVVNPEKDYDHIRVAVTKVRRMGAT
jgi:uncharacterized protein